MAKLGAKFKFPKPQEYAAKEPAIFCPAERVLNLYNQQTGGSAQRIAKTVRAWFAAEAVKEGWAGVHFLKEVMSSYGAGCVLWRPPEQINVTSPSRMKFSFCALKRMAVRMFEGAGSAAVADVIQRQS